MVIPVSLDQTVVTVLMAFLDHVVLMVTTVLMAPLVATVLMVTRVVVVSLVFKELKVSQAAMVLMDFLAIVVSLETEVQLACLVATVLTVLMVVTEKMDFKVFKVTLVLLASVALRVTLVSLVHRVHLVALTVLAAKLMFSFWLMALVPLILLTSLLCALSLVMSPMFCSLTPTMMLLSLSESTLVHTTKFLCHSPLTTQPLTTLLTMSSLNLVVELPPLGHLLKPQTNSVLLHESVPFAFLFS
jgi:hypothetical protein